MRVPQQQGQLQPYYTQEGSEGTEVGSAPTLLYKGGSEGTQQHGQLQPYYTQEGSEGTAEGAASTQLHTGGE